MKVDMERSKRDWIWRRTDEEFHSDCINYQKCTTGTGMMFWKAFRWGKIGLCMFFDLEDGQKMTSVIYRDQILTRPLQEFRKKSFEEIREPIVIEDNASMHKKVCIHVRQELRIKCHEHPPNFSDLNSIENIWTHMKSRITKEYGHVTSLKVMKDVVINI